MSGVENLIGSGFADVLVGDTNGNLISGGAGNDVISGNGGADTLIGGAGNDRLTGGAGADSFRFVATNDGVDVITDFQSGTDVLEVSASQFGGLPLGQLDSGRFAFDSAINASTRFVFDTTAKTLYYDADGSGSGAAVAIACFSAVNVTASNIFVV